MMEEGDKFDEEVKVPVDPITIKKVEEETKEDTGRMFTMKKWNAVAMWSWDVECDTCAICRNIIFHVVRSSVGDLNLSCSP